MNISIGYSPFSYQLEFHKDSARFKIIVGGRRVGKSLSVLHELIRLSLTNSNNIYWWVSPTYAEAREVGFEIFRSYPELLPAIDNINIQQLKITFVNGSCLYFKSADNEKSLRGRGLKHVVLDEAAFIVNPDLWHKVIRPALSDKQGGATLISSPNGRNWFYELYKNTEGKENWSRYHWPTHINPMISPEEIESVKDELSELAFRQEFLAEFVAPAGMVYDDFSIDHNVIDSFTPTNIHDIYLGADFGFANPTAVAFIAVDRITRKVYIFDEIYDKRLPMNKLLDTIRQKEQQWGIKVDTIYTDPAGNAEELTSGISPVDFLRMKGDYRVLNKGSRIMPGVALVRSFIKSAADTRRLFVLNKCEETIRSLSGYCYQVNKSNFIINEEPWKDGIHDHMCDAIRYFFVNKFDNAKYVAKSLDQHSLLTSKNPSVIMKKCVTCRKMYTSRTPKKHPPFHCNECAKRTKE